jgi:hypothetical protein
MGQSGNPRVLISYTDKDVDDANRLLDALRAAGANVRALRASQTERGALARAISQALNDCDALILVVTPDALRSPVVSLAMDAALERLRREAIRAPVAVLTRPVAQRDIPPSWGPAIWIDATSDRDQALLALASALDLPLLPSSVPLFSGPLSISPQTNAPIAAMVTQLNVVAPSRLRALAAPLALAAAALVVSGVVVALIVSGAAAALLARPDPHATTIAAATARAGTATAASFLQQVNATETAQAFQLTQDYTPAGIGPCDKADPPFDRPDSPAYWEWTPKGAQLRCAGGGVTEVTGGVFQFHGFPGGFPAAFQVSATYIFHTPPSVTSCASLYVWIDTNSYANDAGATFCDTGAWSETLYTANGNVAPGSGSGSVPRAASYNVVITIMPQTFSVTINRLLVIDTAPFFSPPVNATVDGIFLYADQLSSGARLDISKFTIHPIP